MGGLGAQHRFGASLVGLELIEGEFDLPMLGVGVGEVGGGGVPWVQQGGEQPVGAGFTAAVVEAVVDHADDQRLGVAAGVIRPQLGQAPMLLGPRVGDPFDEVAGAWLAKESVRDIYLVGDSPTPPP